MSTRLSPAFLFAYLLPLACGSVAAHNDGSATTGAGGGGAGGGSGGAAVDAAAGGSGGAADAAGGDAAGTGGATTCTGAGICGRGPTGIYCAESNGASGFTSWTAWTDKYSDSEGWKGSQSYWATIQFPDINGDGRADVCGRAMGGISCALAMSTGTFAAPTTWSNGYTDPSWAASPYYWATIQFPDINGDGKADVCGRGSDGIDCAVSTGVNGFGPATNWVANFNDAGGWNASQSYWGTVQFPDVNGDGKADVCGRGAAGVYCATSNGTSAFGAVTLWQGDYSDANGWSGSPSYWGTMQFPDINGDGKADVCARASGGMYCAISNGTNGFGPGTYWSTDFANAGSWNTSQTYWGTIQFPDINGDGKADVCGRGVGGVICGLSDGASGFSTPAVWAAAFSDAAGANGDATLWGTIQFPDLDGDGKADICGRTADGVSCGLSNGTSFAVASWLDQYTDVNGWKTDLSYGATLQTPNLNSTGCTMVTKKSTYTQPLERRLAPF